MNRRKTLQTLVFCSFLGATAIWSASSLAQLPDRTRNPNTANAGIAKSLAQQIGAGAGNVMTPNTSRFIIARDPFRAVRRGRQLFQRKFTRDQGHGPITGEGPNDSDDINNNIIIGAGLADSCAACHGRPKGSAGSGGDVVTRPDSRDAPHLFGLGLKEMLADEITTELRAIRAQAIQQAVSQRRNVTRTLVTSSAKGSINYGRITARPDGTVDTSQVVGVNPDLRIRPFFLHGETISMREFIVGAFNAEMGLEAPDPELHAAAGGARFVTPGGMVLDGGVDTLERPPVLNEGDDSDNDGVVNEIPTSLVDFMEFYLLHYFKAGLGEGNPEPLPPGSGYPAPSFIADDGLNKFKQIGCAVCHIQNLTIARDRRVADLETRWDPVRGNPINNLFTLATAFLTAIDDGSGHPTLKRPNFGSFVVRNIFTDFKRHDLGPNFHEINYDGTVRREFLTTALWGVGSTGPFGHDGRSMTLKDVILRHGGEAKLARDRFASASLATQLNIMFFLNTLVLFPPDDTASNLPLGAAVPSTPGFPQFGHGSIRLVGLFNDPNDPE